MTESLSTSLASRIGFAAVLLIMLVDADAQISAPPRAAADYVNALGIGLSYGVQNERDADFWGWTIDYGRQLSHDWTAGASLMWDKDTTRRTDRPDTVVQSYTIAGTISYALGPRLSLTTGLALGIADDDNASAAMKPEFGDLSTGISLGYAMPLSSRNTLGFSLAYEYNMSQNETDFSFDIGLGWSF